MTDRAANTNYITLSCGTINEKDETVEVGYTCCTYNQFACHRNTGMRNQEEKNRNDTTKIAVDVKR